MADVDTLNCPVAGGFGADVAGTDTGTGTLTDPQMWENQIKIPRDVKYAQTQLGVAANNGGHNLYDMIKKAAIEAKYSLHSIHADLDHMSPVVWDPTSKTTVDSYFPALDLSAITDYQIIDSTGTSSGLTSQPITKLVSAPAVTWLRAFKVTLRRGMASPLDHLTLSTFAVTGGTTLTLVFASGADTVALLAGWNEDASVAGASAELLTYTPDYTKSWVMNIPTALITGGTTVPAGDYTVSSVTAGTMTIVLTIPSTTNVGATASSVQCTLHPFRLVGETGKARIFASQGRVLQGANDGLLENVSGGRRRGRGQGHVHFFYSDSSAGANNGVIYAVGIGKGSSGVTQMTTIGEESDGVNGTPRVGPETDVRSTIVHFYFGLGALEA